MDIDSATDGALARRQFLALGGFTMLSAAALAACGKTAKVPVPQAGVAPSTTALPAQNIDDVTLLRTASSMEHNVIDFYQYAIDAGVLTGPQNDTMKMFQSHHRDQAALFEKTTTDAGGKPFTTANPAIKANIFDPGTALIDAGGKKPDDILHLALVVETVAASTYQSLVPILSKPALRKTVMSVGGVAARHTVVLATFLKGALAPEAVATSAAASTTTTSAAANSAETTAPIPVVPVYQVPSPFSLLTSAAGVIAQTEFSADIPGPNSYAYPDS